MHDSAQKKYLENQTKPATWHKAPEDRCCFTEEAPPLLPVAPQPWGGVNPTTTALLGGLEASAEAERKESCCNILSPWGPGQAEGGEGQGGERVGAPGPG